MWPLVQGNTADLKYVSATLDSFLTLLTKTEGSPEPGHQTSAGAKNWAPSMGGFKTPGQPTSSRSLQRPQGQWEQSRCWSLSRGSPASGLGVAGGDSVESQASD